MRPVIIGLAALLAAGSAAAQTTQPSSTPATSGTPAATSNRDSASGNDNQAVSTTNANAATPAKGHNSFTHGQARGRIAAEGFSQVKGLKKDANGVWRGTAMKDGQSTPVWLDYKGNVGTAG